MSFDLHRTAANFRQVLGRAPRLLGNEAVNFFTNSFRQQGWLGNRLERWARRRSNGKRSRGRAILVKSGRLRRGTRITRIEGLTTYIGNDVPYARPHNEGYRGTVNVKAHKRNRYSKRKEGTGVFSVKTKRERQRTVTEATGSSTVKAHSRRMRLPKRQFMGSSPYLQQRLRRLLQAELQRGLKP